MLYDMLITIKKRVFKKTRLVVFENRSFIDKLVLFLLLVLEIVANSAQNYHFLAFQKLFQKELFMKS